MGRLTLLLLTVLAIATLWKAFDPGSRGDGVRRISAPRSEPRLFIPDDGPEFLWKLKKAELDHHKREQELQEQCGHEPRDQGNQGDKSDEPDSPDNPGGTD